MAYTSMEKELKKTLDAQPYVSTTADIWSANNKSFMGVTVHWIDPHTLKREKAAIACKRFRGSHTYDAITAELEDIFSKYGLNHDKVTACVTDNGSNFVKAFKESHLLQQQQDRHESSDEEEEEHNEEEDEVIFTDLDSVLTQAMEEDAQPGLFVLPPHYRCAAHTLNLIATNEVDKLLSSHSESRAVYRSATAKCSAMWTKASRSTIASEILEKISPRKLIVPTVTRWNSFHDAYSRITAMPLADINNICIKLQIKCMNDREYLFLKEYCSVLKPFTCALDKLQGETTCYYGTLQPTLESLIERTMALQDGLSQMTAALPGAIVAAVRRRFAGILDSKDAVLAAVSLPKFKLRWVKQEEARRDHIKLLLTAECRKLERRAPADPTPGLESAAAAAAASQEEDDDDDDFFSFEKELGGGNESAATTVESEVTAYLHSAVKMEDLHKFPRIKQISLRYNAPTPSSAPVERLFSLGSLILTPKRNRLGDGRFERLLLMRFNRYFSTTPATVG